MFIAAPFTGTKAWKQFKFPLTENVVHMQDGILFSHKNEILPFVATGMDPKIVI